MIDRKIAHIRITSDLLWDILRFPDGLVVTDLARSPDRSFEYLMTVEGDALPDRCRVTDSGQRIETVTPYYRRDYHATTPIDPSKEQTKVETTHFDGFH